ncbi:TetR/AcrR family transcriptional regulator [Actinoplanes sp. ATCC 53533]|uniref:TetR/AcrR family transcriptional regulator n=1 Tax=Actinoplanes sp. ATCC 53533 TaxID=1288362 RepID=UPI001F2A9D26|nr:TetR/AcrR family transcriptional regulator [Actinoplanes sp. ATCC 53533]
MIGEIKSAARHLLTTDGANLSLRAVAREMGMVSSALYRYFASRDDLLTALITDAYNGLGDAAETADAQVADRGDLRGRWLSTCHGVRRWALANPADYTLIFGSPVPGYTAPPDTLPASTRTQRVLTGIFIDGVISGGLTDPGAGDIPDDVLADCTRIRYTYLPDLPEASLAHALLGWTHLVGAITFELFGQLKDVIEARESYFDYQMRQIADLIGL